MRIEFLSTGNELLDGSVVDTNAAYFAARVHARGAAVARHETLPDDLPVLVDALRQTGTRADFVVVSGGLGPTTDDLTVEAAALAAGVELDTDPDVLARLRERAAKRGFVLTPNNERQARVPRGATAIPNSFGTAPMIAVRIGGADCFLLPGVPREFRGLCDQEVLPRLDRGLAAEPGRRFAAARVLKCYGIAESHLDARVAELPARHPHVRVGFRTHAPENHLKLRAEGASEEEARTRLAAAEADAHGLLGDLVFGVDDEEYAAAVVRALVDARATLALAESCTGGVCAGMVTAVPGASDALVFSAVVYQDAAKTMLLGVPAELVRSHGAVSAPVTRALAEAARARSGATFGVGITGWAGPGGGTDADPVGTVYVALSDARGGVEQRHRFGFDRERVRLFAAYQALELVRRRLSGAPA